MHLTERSVLANCEADKQTNTQSENYCLIWCNDADMNLFLYHHSLHVGPTLLMKMPGPDGAQLHLVTVTRTSYWQQNQEQIHRQISKHKSRLEFHSIQTRGKSIHITNILNGFSDYLHTLRQDKMLTFSFRLRLIITRSFALPLWWHTSVPPSIKKQHLTLIHTIGLNNKGSALLGLTPTLAAIQLYTQQQCSCNSSCKSWNLLRIKGKEVAVYHLISHGFW